MKTSKLTAQAIHEIRYGVGSHSEKARRYGISPTAVANLIRNGTTSRPTGPTKYVHQPKPFDPLMATPRTHVNAAMRETYKPEPWGRT